jgi:hypothetical protein
MIRFLWRATRGYRLRPWASPYLRWRMETYTGLHAGEITPRQFIQVAWSNRAEFWRYLRWVSRMSAAH